MVNLKADESPGSRLQVILGKTGSEYVFIKKEGSGEYQKQDFSWTSGDIGIPSELVRNLNNIININDIVTAVSLGPKNEWFVRGQRRDGNCSYINCDKTDIISIVRKLGIKDDVKNVIFGDNDKFFIITDGDAFSHPDLDENLLRVFAHLNISRKDIELVRLFPDGGYFISDSEGMQYKVKNQTLKEILRSFSRNRILDISIAGDGNWVIIRSYTYVCSDGVSECLEVPKQNNPFKGHFNTEDREQRRKLQRRDYVYDFNKFLQESNQLSIQSWHPFNPYRCVEKINMIKLKRIFLTLMGNELDRAECWTKIMKDGSGENSVLSLKILDRCQELQTNVCALHKHPTDLSLNQSNGFIEYDVFYEQKDKFKKGRLYAKGPSVYVSEGKYPRQLTLQGMPKELRAPLVGQIAHDIDCDNSQTGLLCSLSNQHNLKHHIPTIFDYRKNREKWIDSITKLHRVEKSDAKLLPQIVLSGGSYKTWLSKLENVYDYHHMDATLRIEVAHFLKRLYYVVSALGNYLLRHPLFSWMKGEHKEQTVPQLMSKVVFICENEVLTIIHRTFYECNWNVLALIFDGLLVEKSPQASIELEHVIKKAEAACRLRGWDIELKEKDLHGLQDKMIKTIDDANTILWQ